VDIDEEAIQVCVSKGLPVYHGDLDEGLADFGDQALDYVILTNVIQVLHRPDFLMREAARVGRRVIVSFPNFAHWSARLQLALLGRMPRTKRLPYEWYDSPNIHLTTIRDFQDLLRRENLRIHRSVFLRSTRDGRFVPVRLWPNLLAEQAIFMVSRD
jgi:methionine biosynthesis protein MetW